MFKFCEKGAAWGLLSLRVVIGISFVAHGFPKLMAMGTTIEHFRNLGLPPFITILVTIAEAVGGLALIAGAFTRLAAAGIAAVMLGAIIMVHAQHGFFMNWFMTPGKGHGYEYHLIVIAGCIALFCGGAGRLSVDNIFARLQESKLQRHSYDERG